MTAAVAEVRVVAVISFSNDLDASQVEKREMCDDDQTLEGSSKQK
jgi:hypothetical protein